jgi:Dyp-type peroxidase family
VAKLVSSKHLEGISDLTLTAPIKQGFVPALENVTYETRLRLVMKGLFRMRATAREYAKIKPFVETAERIQSLLDFRLTVLDGPEPRRLLLTATFDRPFEPYMRLIWNPLGALLDVIFCNCEGYVLAEESRFEDYLAWVRSAQIDTDFFYAASQHTVTDVRYLSQIERLYRDGREPDPELAAAALIAQDPADEAAEVRAQEGNQDLVKDMGVEALVALYRLTDYYPPFNAEGRYLQRAAKSLLQEWDPGTLHRDIRAKLRGQLAWLGHSEEPRPPVPERRPFEPKNVQAGIVHNHRSHHPATHGCLVLMRVADPAEARRFVRRLRVDAEGLEQGEDGVFRNIAFTAGGLEAIGVPVAEIAKLPQEFREGMAERAGLLGDIRANHPRNWDLPKRNWPAPASGPAADARIELSDVHVVVQLRTVSDAAAFDVAADTAHPLRAAVEQLTEGAAAGFEILSVESMRRASDEVMAGGIGRDHFGFADGFSQPCPPGAGAPPSRDDVSLGELLWGYRNDRGDPARPPSPWFDDGSFLVVRKLAQEAERFDAFIAAQAERNRCKFPGMSLEEIGEELRGKMIGRRRNGDPMLKGTSAASNEFSFVGDPRGSECPFQAHIRRANPRPETNPHGRPVPRIMRRGMSYGPKAGAAAEAERGILFMAYNGSIAEQFEVIQGWISGGNSTGVASAQGDPLMGIARDGDVRTFTFRHDGNIVRLPMPDLYVTLKWGLYLFAPSLAGLQEIGREPPSAQQNEAERGRALIARIAALPRREAALAWKVALEDVLARDPAERAEGPAIWAAIRKYHGGALRVPYGDMSAAPPGAAVPEIVLAGSRELVDRVWSDDSVYSACGYMPRMRDSIGEIYLGLDDGPRYRALSATANAAVGAVDEDAAFKVAYRSASAILAGTIALNKRLFARDFAKVDLAGDFVVPVLAQVCRFWFGIPDHPGFRPDQPPPEGTFHVYEGGRSTEPMTQRKPVCPGDFLTPSRFCFYPDPSAAIAHFGKEHGQGLRAAVRGYFADLLAAKALPSGPIAKAIYAGEDDPDQLARTLVGVMMGFLPPADGNLRGTLHDWIQAKSLWRVQRALLSQPGEPSYARAAAAIAKPLIESMQRRPAPDAVWRTAKRADRLGDVDIRPGDRVHVGIVSATQEAADAGALDVFPVFGGNRRAEPHPTHACPAYRFAMGTMIGMLAGLLESGRIAELPSPLIVSIR